MQKVRGSEANLKLSGYNKIANPERTPRRTTANALASTEALIVLDECFEVSVWAGRVVVAEGGVTVAAGPRGTPLYVERMMLDACSARP